MVLIVSVKCKGLRIGLRIRIRSDLYSIINIGCFVELISQTCVTIRVTTCRYV